ncbi:MAG TPA: DegT/DnrJ/EryC1/StrS family aminotransferase [Acidimicrobiales bacterium]|nr:DegT/DnrJ/EryC1/StrS family aminotransferase [Acidimicrobiales bacterium]
MVPVVDLSRRAEALAPGFDAAVARVLSSGRFLLGAELEALEDALVDWSGQGHAVGVSSGASAIQLALSAAGIGPGDEVLVPAFTAAPTASAVCAVGAVPVPVDVDPTTALVEPGQWEACRTERTRAIVVVHLYGRPAALPTTDLAVIEDAAQAHGALSPAPRNSLATVYSFYPTKNLGGIGDGGAVVTDDAELAARVRRLRVHGMEEHYVHVDRSQNFRMSELEAAWLRLALDRLEAGNDRRRAIAGHYRGAAPLEWQADHPEHVHHLAVFRSADRRRARETLSREGVATAIHYPLSLTQQPAYRELTRRPCPESEAWAASCVTVPCFPELRDDEVERVAEALGRLAADGVADG